MHNYKQLGGRYFLQTIANGSRNPNSRSPAHSLSDLFCAEIYIAANISVSPASNVTRRKGGVHDTVRYAGSGKRNGRGNQPSIAGGAAVRPIWPVSNRQATRRSHAEWIADKAARQGLSGALGAP